MAPAGTAWRALTLIQPASWPCGRLKCQRIDGEQAPVQGDVQTEAPDRQRSGRDALGVVGHPRVHHPHALHVQTRIGQQAMLGGQLRAAQMWRASAIAAAAVGAAKLTAEHRLLPDTRLDVKRMRVMTRG